MSTLTKQWSNFELTSVEKTILAIVDEWSSRPPLKADEFDVLKVRDLNIMIFDDHEFCMDIETQFGVLLEEDFITNNLELTVQDFVRLVSFEVL